MLKHLKVAITGAAGQIGYAALFRIASGQMFGKDTTIDLQLIELEQSLPSLEGVAMELNDCAFPLLKNVVTTSDLRTGMSGINWAILIGSVPRKQGMERSDLLKINGGVFTAQGKAINDYAADDVRVFVVGNPCNTNCLIAMHSAPGISRDSFYSMTMLDEKRACYQLANKAKVGVEAVTKMMIWGNHSATQYPDFYNAKIHGKPVVDVIKDTNWLENEFVPTIQQRGAAVIKARGASSAASAANGIVEGVRHLVFDTSPNESYSVSRVSNGEYGIDEGLVFSYPCRTEKGEVKVVSGLTHNEFGKEKLRITLDELRKERDAVIELGLVKK